MKNVIITTSIYPPTKAVEAFDALSDWTLVVVGDKATPAGYTLNNGVYLSPEEQEVYQPELSARIGWNTHARRSIGHLWAWDKGAEVIAIVDDDNIPLPHWGHHVMVGSSVDVNYYRPSQPAFDPVGATNYSHLWHRGFPLQLIAQRDYSQCHRQTVQVDIQADFWNGAPDVDAICRMIYAPECTFDASPFPMASNRPAPFNSQNIFLSRAMLPHYFVLPHVTPHGRMSDIWMAYHMQALGFQVVFSEASVYQDRHAHDVTVDMQDEIIGYEKNIDIVNAIVNQTYRKEDFWPEQTCQAYEAYQACFEKQALEITNKPF